MRVGVPTLLVLAGLLAGCVAMDESDPAPGADAASWMSVDGTALVGTTPWTADVARIEPVPEEALCGPKTCLVASVVLDLPEGFWDVYAGGLEVVANYPETGRADVRVEVADASGRVVSKAPHTATYADFVQLEKPASGAYDVRFVGDGRTGAFSALVQFDVWPVPSGPARALLPDLVVLPPLDLWVPPYPVGVFGAGNAPPVTPPAIDVRGCDVWEVAEQSARKCLRLTNSVGNIGEGFLEVHLTFEQGALAAAGQGRFFQRVYDTAGGHEDTWVDGAEFHPTHAHFHYEDLAVFRLHEYDLATGTRGQQVAETAKSGFCFYDMGIVYPDHVGTTAPLMSDEARCLTHPEEDWVTGVSPGWFDRYWEYLSDQYVEITGLPDGVYELVTTANGAGTLLESDPDNNSAGAVFELAGNEVVVLSTWADYLVDGSA